MFDFMKNLIPITTLLKMVATEIVKQTGKPCEKYDIVYKVKENDLLFVVQDPITGKKTVHGYEDKTIIGNFIKQHALSKLEKNQVLDYVVIHWALHGEQRDAEIYFTENGERKATNFNIINVKALSNVN